MNSSTPNKMRCFEHGDKIPLKTWLNFQWSTIWNCATIRSCSVYTCLLHMYTSSIRSCYSFPVCRSCACNSNSVLMFNWPKQSDTSKAIEILFAIAYDKDTEQNESVYETQITNTSTSTSANAYTLHTVHTYRTIEHQNTEITHRNHCFRYLSKRNWSTF